MEESGSVFPDIVLKKEMLKPESVSEYLYDWNSLALFSLKIGRIMRVLILKDMRMLSESF